MYKFLTIVAILMTFALASPAFAGDTPAQSAAETETATECATTPNGDEVATSCQRCGDGYCAKSCESEETCPQDCAKVDS